MIQLIDNGDGRGDGEKWQVDGSEIYLQGDWTKLGNGLYTASEEEEGINNSFQAYSIKNWVMGGSFTEMWWLEFKQILYWVSFWACYFSYAWWTTK